MNNGGFVPLLPFLLPLGRAALGRAAVVASALLAATALFVVGLLQISFTDTETVRVISTLLEVTQPFVRRVNDGADSYLVRDGRIHAMSIHYTVRALPPLAEAAHGTT